MASAESSPKSTDPVAVADSSSSNVNVSLAVLMGLPASGKSTLANKLIEFCSTCKVIVVSFDDFVPLPVQSQIIENISEKSEGQSQDQGQLKCTNAKILRKKFVSCLESLVQFCISILNDDDNSSNLKQKYLEDLKSFLSSNASVNGLISDDEFLSKIENAFNKVLNTPTPGGKLLIVVDDNNYYRSMRNDFYQVAKMSEVGFSIIYCKCSVKECLRRNSTRPAEAQVPPKAIVEMGLKLEEPNCLQNHSQCPSDMYCVQIENDNNEGDEGEASLNLTLLEQVISSTFCNPLRRNEDRSEEIERERRICSESEVHQADLILRRWISKKFNLDCIAKGLAVGGTSSSNCSSDFKRKLSEDLNSRKRLTLERLKCGELKVSYSPKEDVEFREEVIKMFEDLSL